MTPDPFRDWPPAEDHMWLVHGTMGAPVATIGPDGGGRAVLLRIAARRNQGAEELDATYALDLDEVTSILSGLITMGNAAFGRDALTEAMAAALHMSPEDRRAAATEAARRLAEDTP